MTVSEAFNVNSTRVLAALLLVHTIGPQSIIVLPALTQGYVEQLGMSEANAGFLTSVEAWGISIAALSMMYLIRHFSWRLMMRVSLYVMVLANGLCLLNLPDAVFYACRFAAGFAGGIIVAVSYAMIGQTERTQRNFGLAIALVLVYGAVAFPAIAYLYKAFGMSGAFGFFACFAVTGLPFVGALPDRGGSRTQTDTPPEAPAISESLLASACMLLYFIGLMGVWSYFYRFGVRYGLSSESVGYALSISQFAGVAGAFLVVLFERVMRLSMGLLVGVLGCSIVIAALVFDQSYASFLVLTLLFQFAWNMTHPLLLSALARLDETGTVIAYGTGMQFLGMALGPSIAALLVTEESLSAVAFMGAFCTALSLAAVLLAIRLHAGRRSNNVEQYSH